MKNKLSRWILIRKGGIEGVEVRVEISESSSFGLISRKSINLLLSSLLMLGLHPVTYVASPLG